MLDRDPTGATSGAGLSPLFDAVWKPVAGRASTRRVAIVPSRRLQQLAFVALRDPNTGRYLVEDREIVIAPSAAMFLAASHRLERAAPVTRVLVAGGYEAHRPDLPPLKPLPAAAEELRAVGSQYAQVTQLTGPSATRDAFLAAIPDQDVVHFAGHALVSRRYPFMSRLVMAGASDGANGGDLFASEIGALKLARTRLVVLSACSSGTGASAAGEGVLSLARPFIAAGVPAVVGSLWDVDDEATSALMRRFHEEYSRSGDAGASLRAAQVSLLRDTDPRLSVPAAWAAFTVVGGEASVVRNARKAE
jgi:CHAT domain-containing protein